MSRAGLSAQELGEDWLSETRSVEFSRGWRRTPEVEWKCVASFN